VDNHAWRDIRIREYFRNPGVALSNATASLMARGRRNY
jgi:hypothetical protein